MQFERSGALGREHLAHFLSSDRSKAMSSLCIVGSNISSIKPHSLSGYLSVKQLNFNIIDRKLLDPMDSELQTVNGVVSDICTRIGFSKLFTTAF